ncbi:hypothetical protein MHAE_01385 [Mycobacterium haemophilum DSM 44634]
MLAVLVVRYTFFNTSLFEVYLNNSIGLFLVCNLLREKTIEEFFARHHLMTVTTAQELSWVAIVLPCAEFMGFIALWSGLPPQETRHRQRYHRSAAIILSGAFLIAASRARAAGQILELAHGWDIVLAWFLWTIVLDVLGIQMMIMSVTEWRRTAKWQERLIAGCTVMVGGFGVMICIGSLCYKFFEQLSGVHNSHFVSFLIAVNSRYCFWQSLVLYALAAVPAVGTLRARAGLDGTSRAWHALQGLRETLTAVVPESVFEWKPASTSRQKTVLELHQTIIEIRDAILLLRPYFREISLEEEARFVDRYVVPTGQRDAAIQALQIAKAVHAKGTGARPEPIDAAMVRMSCATDLGQETAELIQLCQWWPSAQAAIHQPIVEHPERVSGS